MDGNVLVCDIGCLVISFGCEILFCIMKYRYEFMQCCGAFCFLI